MIIIRCSIPQNSVPIHDKKNRTKQENFFNQQRQTLTLTNKSTITSIHHFNDSPKNEVKQEKQILKKFLKSLQDIEEYLRTCRKHYKLKWNVNKDVNTS